LAASVIREKDRVVLHKFAYPAKFIEVSGDELREGCGILEGDEPRARLIPDDPVYALTDSEFDAFMCKFRSVFE
jgi:hypothetical protein